MGDLKRADGTVDDLQNQENDLISRYFIGYQPLEGECYRVSLE